MVSYVTRGPVKRRVIYSIFIFVGGQETVDKVLLCPWTDWETKTSPSRHKMIGRKFCRKEQLTLFHFSLTATLPFSMGVQIVYVVKL